MTVGLEYVGMKSSCPECSQPFRIPPPPDEIKFTCSVCKTKMALHKSYVGTKVGCPECRVDIIVPDPNAVLKSPSMASPKRPASAPPPPANGPSRPAFKTPAAPPPARKPSANAGQPNNAPTTKPPNLGGGSMASPSHPALPPTPGCPNCGGKLAANAILCVLCGFNLESGETMDSAAQSPPSKPSRKPKKKRVTNTGSPREIKIREEHIKHERSLRGAATLQLFGGSIYFLAGITMLFSDFKPDQADVSGSVKLFGAILTGLGFLIALVGWGVRRLKPWSRLPFILLNLLGLLAFPIGTMISGYCLYLTAGANGKYILSEEYQRIVERTPAVKAKTSMLVWIILVVLIAGLLLVGAVATSR